MTLGFSLFPPERLMLKLKDHLTRIEQMKQIVV